MQNYEQAVNSTNVALNSAGSGTRENEQYLNSLEARLNKVKNAWTELAIVSGDALLSDAIVGYSEIMVDVTKSASGLVKEIGFLPPVLGATTIAIVAMNNSLRSTAIDMGKGTIAATGWKAKIDSLKFSALSTGTAFATMGRFLLGALPPVALIMGVSFAIEKMVSSFVKARKEAQELQKEVNKLVDSYDKNISELDSLISKYDQLSKKVSNNEISSNDTEYLETQQKIYEMLPNLAERVEETEDGKTQAYLKTAEAIQTEISALEELRGLESKKFVEEFSSSLNDINKEIEETEKRIDQIGKSNSRANSITGGGVSVITGDLSTEQQAQKIIDERELNKLLDERVNHYKKLATEYANEIGVKQLLTDEDQKYINTIIDENKHLTETKEGQKDLRNTIQLLTGDVAELRKSLGSSFDLSFLEDVDIQPSEILNSDEMLNALQQINDEVNNSNPNWENLKQSLVDTGLSFKDAETIINGFNTEYQKTQELLDMGLFRDAEGKFPIKTHEEYNKVIEEGGEIYHEVNGEIVKLNDSTIELTQNTEELADISQILFGINKDEVELLEYHARIYEVLSQQQNLNAQQTEALAQAKEYLSSKYPHLIQNEQLLIKEIYNEIGADKALLKATAGLASGMLTNQQAMTATALIESENRIKILKAEIAVMQEMMNKVNLTLYGEEGGVHGATTGTANALQSKIDDLSNLNVELDKSHQQLITDFENQNESPSSTKSGSSSTNDPAQKDKIDALIRQFNLQQEIISIESDRIRKQIEQAKAQGDYNAQLELTNQLTQNEQKRISELQKANQLIHERANIIRKTNSQFDTSTWFDMNNEETVAYQTAFNKASKETRERMSDIFSQLQRLKNAYGDNSDQVKILRDELLKLEQTKVQIEVDYKIETINDELDEFSKKAKELNHSLEIEKAISPNDYSRLNDILGRLQVNERNHNEFLRRTIEQLRQQRATLRENSAEWDTINNKIGSMNDQLRQSNMELINNAREMLNNRIRETSRKIELEIFDGKTEQQAREDFEHKLYLQGKYLQGAEKELEIAKMRKFIEQENLQLTQEQQDLLNSNDKIERASLERMQKQLDIQRLQLKLDNLRNQKTIQQLTQLDDGTWDYQYVEDKDAIYQTEQELAEKRVELTKWEQDYQNDKERKFLDDRSKYLRNINDLTQRLLDGEFETIQEFYKAIEDLNADFFSRIDGENYQDTWQNIFGDVKPLFNEMTSAFEDYLSAISALGGEFVQIEKGLDKLINRLLQKSDEFYEVGNRIGEKYLKGLAGAIEEIFNDGTLSEIEKHEKALNKMGEALLDFSLTGDIDGIGFIYDAIQNDLAADPLSAVEGYLQGKLSDFQKSGDSIGEAFVKGMIGGLDPLSDEIDTILSDKSLEFDEKISKIHESIANAFENNEGYNLVGKEGGREYIEGLTSQLISGRQDVAKTTQDIVKSLEGKSKEFQSTGDTQGASYVDAMIGAIKDLGDSPELTDVLDILNNALDFDIGSSLTNSTYIKNALENTTTQLKEFSKNFKDVGNDVAKSYADGLLSEFKNLEGSLTEKQSNILDVLKGDLVNYALSGNQSGQEFVKGLIDEMSSTNLDTELSTVGDNIKSQLQKSLSNLGKLSDPAGVQFVQGLIKGIERIENSDIPNKTEEIMDLLNRANDFGTLGSNLGESYLKGLVSGLSDVSGKMGKEIDGAKSDLMTATDGIINSLKGKSNDFAQSGNLQGVAYTESLISQLENIRNDASATVEDISSVLQGAMDFDLGEMLGVESEFSVAVSFDVQEPEIPEIPDTESTHTVNLIAPPPPSFPDTSSTHTVNVVVNGDGKIGNTSSTIGGLGGVTNVQAFDTGGYTGTFGGSNGKLAFLHEKELVLNDKDTENMLKAIDMTRQLTDSINKPNFSAIQSAKNMMQQIHNHIGKVEFPNVTNSQEIQDAFSSLSRKALQYVPSK